MTQSLHGLRILNTRPTHQAQRLNKSIKEAGGIAIECPTLEIKATDNQWIKTLPNLNKVNLAIFISANAVHFCFTQLNQHQIKWPDNIKVIAIGQGSANALKEYNIKVYETPAYPNSEHLLSLNSLHHLNNQTVLLFKGIGGRKLIEEELLQKGAHVIILPVYQRVMPTIQNQFINSVWHDDLVDIILLTSEQAMHHLFNMFGQGALGWLQNKPHIVISERLAKAASLMGIKKIIVSHPDRMMNTLFDCYQGLIHDK